MYRSGLLYRNGEPIQDRPTENQTDRVAAVSAAWGYFRDIFEEWPSDQIVDFENQTARVLSGVDLRKNDFQIAKILEENFGFTAKPSIVEAIAWFKSELSNIVFGKIKIWASGLSYGIIDDRDQFQRSKPGDLVYFAPGRIFVRIVRILDRSARVVVKRCDDDDFFPWGVSFYGGFVVHAEDLHKNAAAAMVSDSRRYLEKV